LGAEVRSQISASSGKGRTRSAISTAIAIERIQKMTQGIIQDVQRALALKAALEVGNDTIGKLRGDRPALSFYGAPAYDEIMFGLTASLALTLSKLFDPVTLFLPPATKKKKKSVNKSDVISIPLLVRLLKQRRCQTVLGKQARGWTPMLDDMEPFNEQSAIGAANAAVSAYEDFRRTRDGRSAARILKMFRNNELAHTLLDKQAPRPRYNELFLLLEIAATVAAKASLAVLGDPWDVEDTREARALHSKAFWDPALQSLIEAERQGQ
jgi:AbiU2